MKNKIIVSYTVRNDFEEEKFKNFIKKIDKRKKSISISNIQAEQQNEHDKKTIDDIPTMCIRIISNNTILNNDSNVLSELEQLVSYGRHKLFLDLELMKNIKTTYNGKLSLKDRISDIISLFDVYSVVNVHPNGELKEIKSVISTANEIYSEYEKEVKKLNENNVLNYMQKSKLEKYKSKLDNKVLFLGNIDLNEISEDVRTIIGNKKSELEQIVELALLFKKIGYSGVVCGPKELLTIKEVCGDEFIVILDDTKYTKENNMDNISPKVASSLGANYLIVDKIVTDSDNPILEYKQISKEFDKSVGFGINSIEKKYMDSLGISMHNYSKEDIAAKIIVESNACKINIESPVVIDGIDSPINIDMTELYKNPNIQKSLVDYILDIIKDNYNECEAIYTTDKINPLLAILVASRLSLPLGIVSSSSNNEIIGYKEEGTKCVLIDDILVNGTDISNSIINMKLNWLKLMGIVSLANNDFISKKTVSDFNIKYNWVTNFSKLLYYLGKSGMMSLDLYNVINSYKENPYDNSWTKKKIINN